MPVGDTVSQPYLSSSNHSDLYYGVDVYRRDQKKKNVLCTESFSSPDRLAAESIRSLVPYFSDCASHNFITRIC